METNIYGHDKYYKEFQSAIVGKIFGYEILCVEYKGYKLARFMDKNVSISCTEQLLICLRELCLKSLIISTLKSFILAPIKEVFEEIIKDGFIEALIENIGGMIGLPEDVGFWLSSMATSWRETSGALAQISALGRSLGKGGGLKNVISIIKSGDKDALNNLQKKMSQNLDQQQDTDSQSQQQGKSWQKLIISGFFRGISMVMSTIYFGSFSFLTLKSLKNIITDVKTLSPKAYGEYKAQQHAQSKKELEGMATKNPSMATGNILIDNMKDGSKQPAGINQGTLHNLFREMQESNILNPPAVDKSILFNPNPMVEQRNELAKKFNTIAFNSLFSEWIDTLNQDERFQSYKEDFEKIENNYKEIGVQKAEEEIISIIKEALSQKGTTNLRFVNMFGTEFYDPDFILLGAPLGANAKIKSNILKQDRFKASMSTLDKVNELKDQFDIHTDLELFVLKDNDMHRIPIDSSTNLADWLQDNMYSIDDKILVLPDYNPPIGQPMFKDVNWKPGELPSPNFQLFQDFLIDLTAELDRMNILDVQFLSDSILDDLPNVLQNNGYSLNDIFSDLKEGKEFLNFDERTLDRWYIVIKNKILEKRNPSAKVELKTIRDFFDTLHRKIGSSSSNAYYRQAKLAIEEITLILLQEGVFDNDPPISEVSDYLEFKIHSFLSNLKRGIQVSPHKPEVLLKFKKSIDTALDSDPSLNSDDIDRISKKIEDSLSIYSNIVEKYWHAEGVWESEDGLFYRVKSGPKKKLISNIFHSHEVLEQIEMKSKLSRLLFASPDYLTSHFLDNQEIDRRPAPDRLERMNFLVSRWDTALFKSLSLEVSGYQVEVMKRRVLAEIKKWMFINPRSDYSSKSRLKWKPYISEQFVKWGRTYTEEDLKPHYDLVRSITTALAVRTYKDIDTSSQKTLEYSTKAIREELGIDKGFFISLRRGDLYSQKILENVFTKFAKWHIDEYGDNIRGLDYDRSDSYERLKLYHYQEVLYKVQKYAEARGITLFDGKYSSGVVEIGGIQHKISEIIKKDYDKTFPKTAYKEFHLLFQLAKYLGFDPLTFTPLEDIHMATGRYQLHHFLAEMLRKMSSNVADIVLTSKDLHLSEYESILRNKGEEGVIYAQAREAEALIRALMKSIQDLIGYKVPRIKAEHIKEVLVRNLGVDKGTEIYNKWTGDKDYKDNLILFNARRVYALNGDYRELLTTHYEKTWKNRAQDAYMFISKQKEYSTLFSYQTDFDLLYKIFPRFKKQTLII